MLELLEQSKMIHWLMAKSHDGQEHTMDTRKNMCVSVNLFLQIRTFPVLLSIGVILQKYYTDIYNLLKSGHCQR